ncbi:hypothetical protein BC628DRAFT_1401932 [Trametes gibbosa]|nr:hypothetical protein BC628DRAFT_1401932 [Trametes gibbosa]
MSRVLQHVALCRKACVVQSHCASINIPQLRLEAMLSTTSDQEICEIEDKCRLPQLISMSRSRTTDRHRPVKAHKRDVSKPPPPPEVHIRPLGCLNLVSGILP